jgi:hypothetical protein
MIIILKLSEEGWTRTNKSMTQLPVAYMNCTRRYRVVFRHQISSNRLPRINPFLVYYPRVNATWSKTPYNGGNETNAEPVPVNGEPLEVFWFSDEALETVLCYKVYSRRYAMLKILNPRGQ